MSENPTIERISELDFLETIYEFEDELAQNRLDHITFSSIAAMQANETLKPGDTAIINGAIYDTLEVTEVEDETDMTDPDVIYLYDGTYYKGNSGEEAAGFASENGFVVVSDKNTFVTPEMFGAVGDGVTDDTEALQKTFAHGGYIVFKDNATYIINSINFPNSDGLIITKPTIIKGSNATIKVIDGAEYRSLIYATADTFIEHLKVYENNNNVTNITGTELNYHRNTIWIRHAKAYLNSLTLDNVIGAHQILVTNDNIPSIIHNCVINYTATHTVTFDRTMVYLEGNNILCVNNRLNSNSKAHTAIETHGSNISVENNRCVNVFETGIYVTNTESADNVSIKNNYLSCLRGIILWFEAVNPVGNITIEGNTIEQTADGDYYALNLYDVYNAESVKNISIINNIIRQQNQNTTHQLIYINPSRGSGGVIRHITVSKNWLVCGASNSYVFEITSNSHNTFSLNVIEIDGNLIDCGDSRLCHIISSDGRINNVKVCNNEIKNNGALGIANIAITNPQGFYDFINNTFENSLTALIAGNGTVNTRIYGPINMDLRTIGDRNAKVAEIQALNGDGMTTRGGKIIKELSNNEKLTGTDIYTTGDIIWNSAPLIGQPIGWVSLDHDNFRPFGVINQS